MHFFADEGLIKKEAAEPVKKLVYNGYINGEDGNKMSKSKGSVVDPLEVINEGYGADALRIFELFIGPFDQDANWSTAGLGGAYRFIQRVWTLTQEYLEANKHDGPSNRAILVATNKAGKKVSKDLENLSFNTAVAAMMEFVNELYKIKAEDNYLASDWQYALECLVQIMAPFAPHVAEEMWQQLGHENSIHKDHWPFWDEQYLVADEITVVVQINGKLRGEVRVPAGADRETVLKVIADDKKISGYITRDPKKVIYVLGRLINFVI
jgi:leucyl-tRNA synthetase